MPTKNDYNEMLAFANEDSEPIETKSSNRSLREMINFAREDQEEPDQMLEMQTKRPEEASTFGKTAMRAGEALAGLPRTMLSGFSDPVSSLLSSGLSKLTGKEVPSDIFGGLSSLLPTKETAREYQEKAFGEKFQPTSEHERKLGDLTQSFINTAGPLLVSGGNVLMSLLRSLGIVGAGEVGEKAAKQFGVGKTGQAAAKISSELLASIINPRLGRNLYTRYFNEANRLPETVTGDATQLRNDLRRIYQWATARGQPQTEATRHIRQQIEPLLEELEAQGNNPKASYQGIREFITRLNQNSESLYELPRNIRNVARRRVDEVRNHAQNFMEQSQATHPEFYNNWRLGNEVYSALAGSRQFGDYIKRNADKLAKAGISHHLIYALGHGLEGVSTSATQEVGLGVATGAGYQAYKILYKIAHSPTLTRAYMDALAGGTARNLPETINILKKLDKRIDQEKDTEED